MVAVATIRLLEDIDDEKATIDVLDPDKSGSF